MVIAGRRFGKTVTAVMEIISRAIEQPGSRIWYVAPTKDQAYRIAWRLMLYPRVEKGIWKPPYLPKELIKKTREDKHYAELNNGSLIEFLGVQAEIHLLGAGLDFAVFDEFVNIPYSVYYDTIRPMMMDSGGDMLFIGTLPDPKIHNITVEYLDMFEDCLHGDMYNGKAFTFNSKDNPHIDHEAVEREIADLKKKGREGDAERLYYGKYTREHGLVFPKFNYDIHTVEPFAIPPTWMKIMATDPHPQKPVNALWGAIDQKDHLWIYREKEFRGVNGRPLTVQETAYEMLLIESEAKERIMGRFIDPTFAKIQQNIIGQKCVKDMFRDYGVYFREADRDFMTFFNAFTDMLVDEPEPRVHIFRSCPGLIRQLQHYVWDSWASSRAREEKGVRDKPKAKDDDYIDCLKYIVNSNARPVDMKKINAYKGELRRRWSQELQSVA
jgi:hypothetical protein